MAKRTGKFGNTVPTDYAGSVLKNINELNKGATGTQSSATRPVRTPEQMAQGKEAAFERQQGVKLQQALMGGYNPFAMSAEDIAKDPTLSSLSSGTTLAQAQADYQKSLSVQALMPPGSLATSGSAADRAAYARRMAIYNKAYAQLTPAQTNAQNVFSALGGYVSTNNKPTYGSNAQDIALTWAKLGNLDMAKKIMGSVFGSSTNGNPAGTIPYATGTINPTATITAYPKPAGGLSLTPFSVGKSVTKTPTRALTPAQRKKLRLTAIPDGR